MQYETASDSGLIRRAQAGDGEALATLFSRSEPIVRERIRRRLSPAVRRRVSDSDVLQETLVIAARRIDAFDDRGHGSFQAWLAAIADNAAMKAVERHAGVQKRDIRAEVTRGARAETGQFRGDAPSPSNVAMAGETRRRIAQALQQLSQDHQTVIQLLQHRRVTIAEAAELMGRSTNAVKKLHARALAELARQLGLEDEAGP